MRRIVSIVVALLSFSVVTATAAPLRPGELASSDAVLRWINTYRLKPDPANMPAAMQAMSQLSGLRDPESAGVHVGFVAGVLGANPARTDALVSKLLALPSEDRWVIVRAIAYSGLPDWKDVLRRFADRMPAQQVLIDEYVAGKLPILDTVPLEKTKPGLVDKMRHYVDPDTYFGEAPPPPRQIVFEGSPELLDTLWGFYFATGAPAPIHRMIPMLAWADDHDELDKLTIGSMTKYTLASNAARDPALLAMLKAAAAHQSKAVTPVLRDVIHAAETVDAARIRKDALAAMDELKRKGPGYRRQVSWWGQIGEGAVGAGCVVAAALNAVAFGLPCVIGGAAGSAALHYWDAQ